MKLANRSRPGKYTDEHGGEGPVSISARNTMIGQSKK